MFNLFNKKESISVEELLKVTDGEIIDVRETDEFASGHVPKAKNIPMTGLLMNAEQFLKKDTKYYIICESGGRSMTVVNQLTKDGYNAINVAGGTAAYRRTK